MSRITPRIITVITSFGLECPAFSNPRSPCAAVVPLTGVGKQSLARTPAIRSHAQVGSRARVRRVDRGSTERMKPTHLQPVYDSSGPFATAYLEAVRPD